jgi:hypothetical protein
MLDFCDLIQFFANALEQVNPTVEVTLGDDETQKAINIFDLMHSTLGQIANKLLNLDPQQTEVYFLEYCLEPILDIMASNALKRNKMMYLLNCSI